jgi:hypothetical protein
MMRLTPLLVTLAVAAPSLAAAQTLDSGGGRLDIEGTAPSACVISAPAGAAGANATFQATGARSAQVSITQMVDPQTAVPRATTINLDLPVICNTAHHLVVRTANGGLLRVGASGATQATVNGFREFLPYQVTAAWSGQTVTGGSQTGTPVNITAVDGAAGQVSLTIDVPAGGAPMVAGAYADSLVIELQVAS